MTYTHIETVELASSASSITFSSISADYDDLVLVTSLRTTKSDNYERVFLKINGATTGITQINLQGDGSSVSTSSSQAARFTLAPAGNATSNTFGSSQCYISNYTASQNKSLSIENVMEDNATTAYANLRALLWSNTSAITSLELESEANNLATGSVASLYGVTAGGDGTVTTA